MPAGSRTGDGWFHVVSPRRVGALYLLVVACIVFSFTASATFPTSATVQQVLNTSATSALAALALVVPLAAGVFDLSIGYVMSLSGVLVAYLLVHTDWPTWVCVVTALVAALVVGVVNAVAVVVLGINSLIATLATGALLQAVITAITDDASITAPQLLGGFADIAQKDIGGYTLPILYAVLIAVVIWVFLSHTAGGRRTYATGFNLEAARLAGARTSRLRFGSLLVSSTIAGFAGIVVASNIGAGTPTAGTAYLLPAFAAAFLGATQLTPGRFNAWGTLLATVLLQTGIIGLSLSGAPTWTQGVFTGIVLLAALAFTVRRN
ncbi:ABC transporter permease [Nakamurella alba]|nr:ABC transporter permease [Nakamurella alba]